MVPAAPALSLSLPHRRLVNSVKLSALPAARIASRGTEALWNAWATGSARSPRGLNYRLVFVPGKRVAEHDQHIQVYNNAGRKTMMTHLGV
jgi:hypothetical protein